MKDNTIFFQCIVLNNQDPLMLGRIRARRVIDNYEDIVRSITDPPWNEEKDAWTARDPFIFNSLLPYFMYSTPKVDELVQVMYLNKDFRYLNQYYVQNTLSTPTASFKEFNFGGNKFTGTGMQIKSPLPLKNQDGTYTAKEIHKGVFPQPGDNALLGRGSADVIVQQDNVLIRAGKFKGDILQPNVLPAANQQRAFLQLSKFASFQKQLPPKIFYELKSEVVSVKYLIEYGIINPENTQNKFTGAVYLYQLKPDVSTNSKNLNEDSVIADNLKTLVVMESFQALSQQETISFINNFIKTCNQTNFTLSGKKLFPDNSNNTKFPIFYRPTPSNYAILNPTSSGGTSASSVEVSNISGITRRIRLNPALAGGSGLIYTKGKVGTPTTPIKKVITDTQNVPVNNTSALLGADKVFLLSHNSSIPGKGKINFDNTLYGITTEQISSEIEPKTSSLVRGEELMELINMIVRFLVTHTHAYPGLPPVPITQDGSSVDKILAELQNAVNKILNGNIRLN